MDDQWHTASVKPLPSGGGYVRISPLDERTVTMEVSDQKLGLQHLPIGETLELQVRAVNAIGKSEPATLRIRRTAYDRFEQL